MTVYERIDNILKERGISRRQLARMAGIKEPTIGSIFAKRAEPFPRKQLGPIAEALGMTTDELEGNSAKMMNFDYEQMMEMARRESVSITVTWEGDKTTLDITPWSPYRPVCPYACEETRDNATDQGE